MANEKEINLITGERGFSHVTSEDARVQNRLTYGSGRHFLKYGKEFDFATIDTNTIRIYDGAAYNQGAFIKIDRDNYADVTVDNGLQGLKRSDLIVLRYKRNLYTQLESASVVVLKGESTEGTPVDPEYAVGDIAQGESVDEIPMYRINFTGVKFTIEKLFSTEERSLTIVENTMNNHISDGGIHIKPTERIDWNDANSKKHNHSNKSILDKINQTLLDNWSAAYTHISDAVKHITADERTKWNQAASPVDNLEETTTGKSLDAHQGYVLNEAISTNSYGEYAGGKNLLDVNIMSDMIANIGTPIYKQIKLKQNTTYTMSSDFSGSSFAVAFCGGYIIENMTTTINGVFENSPKTFSSDSDGYVTLCYRAIGDVKNFENLKTYKWQIEEGTQATDYEPYIKSNYQLGRKTTQIDDANMLGYVLPEEMPIKNYVDSNGVFHQRVGRIDMGNLTWNYISSGQFFYADLAGGKIGSENAYCRKYSLSNATFYGEMANKEFRLSLSSETVSRVYVKNTSYTDTTTFKNAMQGQYLYYELATEKTISVDGNEYTNTYKADKSEVCVNLLKPTRETVTVNGVTCTNNGDGTFTFDGTASADATFFIKQNVVVKKGTKLVGCPSGGSSSKYFMRLEGFKSHYNNYASDYGSGSVASADTSSENVVLFVRIISGQTVSDLTFKPMITTDLSATYDDFVPYTGDKGRINEEVAELNKKVTGMFSLDGTTLTITTE